MLSRFGSWMRMGLTGAAVVWLAGCQDQPTPQTTTSVPAVQAAVVEPASPAIRPPTQVPPAPITPPTLTVAEFIETVEASYQRRDVRVEKRTTLFGACFALSEPNCQDMAGEYDTLAKQWFFEPPFSASRRPAPVTTLRYSVLVPACKSPQIYLEPQYGGHESFSFQRITVAVNGVAVIDHDLRDLGSMETTRFQSIVKHFKRTGFVATATEIDGLRALAGTANVVVQLKGVANTVNLVDDEVRLITGEVPILLAVFDHLTRTLHGKTPGECKS